MDARRAGVAMIYQELSIAPHLSVMENIVLGDRAVDGFGVVDRARAREIARDGARRGSNHARHRSRRQAGELSVAAQQVVEIARALAVGSRVLVLDEPTSSLGRQDALRLFEVIADLARQGLAIVYISHFIEEVKAVAAPDRRPARRARGGRRTPRRG